MTTDNKNFKVKNGLNVAGTATFGSNVVLGTTPLRFDTATNKLQIEINGTFVPIAFTSEIPDIAAQVGFMDIGLAIDYNGEPIYTVQGNGVTPEGTSKFLDGGSPSSTDADTSMIFDSGVIA